MAIIPLSQWTQMIISLVFIQLVNTGGNFITTLASQTVIYPPIDVGYRYLIAAAVVIPLAYFKERTRRPPMTWRIFLYGCSCGLLGGALAQNLNLVSQTLTTGVNWTAISNLLPALTFILALIFRLEVLALRTWAGRAKIGGTIVSVGGAMVIIFSRGKRIPLSPRTSFMHHNINPMNPEPHNHPVIGALFALASCLSLASSLLLQARLARLYPNYSSMGLMTGSAAVLSILYAAIGTSNWDAWKLYAYMRLIADGYMGGLVYGLTAILSVWCVGIRGPVFVSAFSPLSIVCLAIIGPIVLREELHLGSILGGMLIIVGISIVLLGKHIELQSTHQSLESPERQVDIESGVVEGYSPVFVFRSSGGPQVGALRRQSSQSSQVEAVSLRNEGLNESGSTSLAALRVEKGTSKWHLNRKRKSRHISKNRKRDSRKYVDINDEPNAYLASIKNLDGFPQGSDQKVDGIGGSPGSYNCALQTRSKLVAEDQVHQTPEFSGRKFCPDSKLYDVKLDVNGSYQPQHVPLVSLVSKLNGKAIVGYPVTVDVLDDGYCDSMMRSIECDATHLSVPVAAETGYASKRSFDDGRIPTGHMSSLTGQRQGNEEGKPLVEKPGTSYACIPVKLVFSRINEAVNGSARPTHRANEERKPLVEKPGSSYACNPRKVSVQQDK